MTSKTSNRNNAAAVQATSLTTRNAPVKPVAKVAAPAANPGLLTQ